MSNEIDITQLPIVKYETYGKDGRYIESEAVAEVNRKMEEWLAQATKEMMASFWKDGEIIRRPQWIQIFLVSKEDVGRFLMGKIKATNVPEDAWLYDIRPWEHTQVLDIYAFWMVHPDFPEYRSGNCAPAEHMLFEEVK